MAVLCWYNDRQIGTRIKGVYRKLIHACAQYISENVDWKNHIKTHLQRARIKRQLILTFISVYIG